MVAEPHVVAQLREIEGWRFGAVHHPVFSRPKQAVLHKYDWCIRLQVRILDPEDTENVAVLGGHVVALVLEALVRGQLEHGFEEVGVLLL